MKKTLMTLAVILAACVSAFAQEKGTVISRESAIDYGVYYGNGDGRLANFGGAFIDYNFNNSNFRLRGMGGLMELPNCPFLALDAQYLFKTVGNLYLYPTAGVYGEYHNKDTYKEKTCTGLTAGVGAEYQISPAFGIFAEARRQFLFNVDNRTAFNIGIITHLGKRQR